MARPASTRVTSPYGYSAGYVGFHRGIDFAHVTSHGTPVFAYKPGRVISIGWVPGWSGLGLVVKIDHGYGIESWSCHLASASVNAGDWVAEGQTIATMGKSATTAVHLHWCIVVDGVMVDPTPYLIAASSGGSSTVPIDNGEDDMFSETDRTQLTAVYAAMFGPANVGSTQLSWAKTFGEAPGLAYYGSLDIAIGTQSAIASLTAQVAGLSAAVTQLAKNGGGTVDLAAITEAAEQGATEALGRLVVRVEPDALEA